MSVSCLPFRPPTGSKAILQGGPLRSAAAGCRRLPSAASHELGHALVASSIPGSDPVQKVSIIPRSMGAPGFTMQRPTDDRHVITAGELRDRMAVLLGGRAAERLVFGDLSTCAADDLAKATDIGRRYVTRSGMSEITGQPVLEQVSQPLLSTAIGSGRRGVFGGHVPRSGYCRSQHARSGSRSGYGSTDQQAS